MTSDEAQARADAAFELEGRLIDEALALPLGHPRFPVLVTRATRLMRIWRKHRLAAISTERTPRDEMVPV